MGEPTAPCGTSPYGSYGSARKRKRLPVERSSGYQWLAGCLYYRALTGVFIKCTSSLPLFVSVIIIRGSPEQGVLDPSAPRVR